LKDNESLFYNLSEGQVLADPATIAQLLQELVQRGYLLMAEAEASIVSLAWMLQLDPPWPHWTETDRANNQVLAAPYLERILTPGVTEQLHQGVDQFQRGQQESLRMFAHAVSRTGSLHGHTFDLMLALKESCLVLNYTNDFWTTRKNEQARVEAFDHFLEIVKLLYALSHPIYAYAWNHNGSIPLTGARYLEQRQPHRLYEINLFGPEMVERLRGNEYVLRTPAQFVHSFSDGGVLIIPEAPWYPGSLPYTWSKVARYLGVVCPDFALDEDEEEDEESE
jgi:hypothetical protein